jgi:hypothetical protein
VRHYDTQVCWNNIPASSIGCFGMCSLTTVFALMLFAKMFLQILMVTKKKQRGGIQMGTIHMLKVGRWV